MTRGAGRPLRSRLARTITVLALGLIAAGSGSVALAQQPPPAPRVPPTPKAAAPIDLTGNWVSVVTEDWRWRMVVPRKGDYSSVPLTAEGKKLADTWDPAKATGDGCKAYGAAGVMRVPGRLRIAWENDTTIRIDTDAGQQTRLLRFEKTQERTQEKTLQRTQGPPRRSAAARTWQGQSVAEWERIVQPGGLGVSLAQAPPRVGTLKAVTTNLRAGYLRMNGVPYSENAVVTEYFDRPTIDGVDWVTVLTIVEDPVYLNQPFITSTHFKREADASKWMPTPCEAGAGTR